MKKMSTLFVVTHNGKGSPSTITEEVRPENEWVFTESNKVKATRKFDGTACAIIDGELFKRYDAKHGKSAPEGAIPCGEADLITGHHPHWLKVDLDAKENRYFREAWVNLPVEHRIDGTYEMCGEKVGINAEKIHQHELIRHGSETMSILNLSFEGIKLAIQMNDIEGIVFHHDDGRMCKIRKSDFGFKRGE